MMSHSHTPQQQRARAILTEINSLCQELDGLLLEPTSVGPLPVATAIASWTRWSGTRDSLIGCRVQVTKGKYNGLCGRVTRPRGDLYYYLVLDDGREVFKQPGNLTILCRQVEAGLGT